MSDSLQWMVHLQPNRSEGEAEEMLKADWSETSMYTTSSAKGGQSSEDLEHSGDEGRA